MFDDKRENCIFIMVDNEKLEEHRSGNGNTYVWMPLFHKRVGYGVEFVEEIKGYGAIETVSQTWPVCPYTVKVSNLSGGPNFAILHVDGQRVAEKFVGSGQSTTFEGIPTESGIQELLFSLPRYATLREKNIGGRALPEALTTELGTIRVEWRDCVMTGTSFNPHYKKYWSASFTQANKFDAKASSEAHVAEGDRKPFASTTRAGKVVGLNEARSCNVTNYKYVGEPWSACVLYRTKEYLQDMEVIPKEPVSDEELERQRRRRACLRKRNRELSEAYNGGAACPTAVAVDESEPPSVPTSDKKEVISS